MKNKLALSLFLFTSIFAQMPLFDHSQEKRLTIQNTILAKVYNNTISVIDVMKKMDMLFHRSYPHLIDNEQYRYQFYVTHWKHVFNEMIDTELMLADAETKELKITDSEIREQMGQQFGPNVIRTLDKVGISYDEAWKMLKTEMIVQRMTWFYVHSKALSSVIPQKIREAYHEYLKENPAKETWTYQFITICSPDEKPLNEEITSQIHSIFASYQEDGDSFFESFKEKYPGYDLRFSQEYQINNEQISENYRLILSNLAIGEYSPPILQKSLLDKEVYRIFFLKNYTYDSPPSFNEMANHFREELLQSAVGQEYNRYLTKLRKYYGYDEKALREMFPENFEPFQW